MLTDRGEPIAVVKPLESLRKDKGFDAMVMEGLIVPAQHRGPNETGTLSAAEGDGKSLGEMISHDREERL